MPTPTIQTETAEYKNLIKLLSAYSTATHQLDSLKADSADCISRALRGKVDKFAKLQTAQATAEKAIREIVKAHPEWFPPERKTINTPFGSVSSRSSTKLDVEDENASVRLIQERCKRPQRIQFLRPKVTLNLEALEKLTDEQLAEYGIKRVTDDNLQIKPSKVNLSKLTKGADKDEEQPA